MSDDSYVYLVSYENEYGSLDMAAEFSRDQAAEMVGTLFRSKEWGDVTAVKVAKTEKLLDQRSIAEIESNVVS